MALSLVAEKLYAWLQLYKLTPKNYIPFICEGFGFLAIGKDEDNEIFLAMPAEDIEYIQWKPYDEVIK